MKKSKGTINENTVGMPAIVIDEEHLILFPTTKTNPRLGLLSSKKKPSQAEIEDVISRTGTKFGITDIFYDTATVVYFLGDLRTLKTKINRWY